MKELLGENDHWLGAKLSYQLTHKLMIEYPLYDAESEIEDVEQNAYELLDELNEALADVVKKLYDLELRLRRFSSLRKISNLP